MYNLWYIVAFYIVLLQKVLFFAIYAVFRKIGLLQFTRCCVEKILAKNSVRGEKMTNIRYENGCRTKHKFKKCPNRENMNHSNISQVNEEIVANMNGGLFN